MDGLVLIDKPAGYTSFDVVAVMRRVLGTRKIGHTGTLDPMATGVLPLLVGKATKLCDGLPVSDKTYLATLQLGVTTDTLDATGQVLTRQESHIAPGQIRALLPAFTGPQSQIPPMYSAVSVGGVRLYDLARQGQTVERAPRSITVYALEYIQGDPAAQTYTLRVRCSKGTYVRALVHDMGQALGCGAVLTALRRTEASGFSLQECVPLEEAKTRAPEALLLPVERAVRDFPALRVTGPQAVRFQNGGALDLARLPLPGGASGSFRVYDPQGKLLGLGRVDPDAGALKLQCLL